MSLAATRVQFTRLLAKMLTEASIVGIRVALDEGRVLQIRTGLDPRNVKGRFIDRVHIPQSLHYRGLAVDLACYDADWVYIQDGSHQDYSRLGKVWKSLDPMCTWGGDFSRPDPCHFSFGEGK